MVANTISLTNRAITPVAGQAALLPNQPIIHGAIVSPEATAALVPGDIVKLSTAANYADNVVVEQAAATDTPCGVVVYNAIKSSFAAGERVSVFPAGSFVYLPSGEATIARGAKLGFNENNQVVAATAGNGVIGIAWTESTVTGDLVIVQIQPGAEAAA